MLLSEFFENVGLEVSNEVTQILLNSDTYDKNSLKRMGYVKIENHWICRESKIDTSDFTKKEPKENWTHSDAPNIPDQDYIDEPSTSFKPIHKTTDNTPSLQNLSYFFLLDHVPLSLLVKKIVNFYNFLHLFKVSIHQSRITFQIPLYSYLL